MHTNILIRQLVGEADSLRLVLDRLAVDNGGFELLDDALVDLVTLKQISTPLKQEATSGGLTKSSTVHLFARSTTGAE